MTADGPYLAIDTATTRVVVAVGGSDGRPAAGAEWRAGYHHGQLLLESVARVLAQASVGRLDLAGVVVGTGPGAFTGLRVGLATAKALAHALDRPIVGVPTGEALLAAFARTEAVDPGCLALLLPAGPADRVLVRPGEAARLLPGGSEPPLPADAIVLALDLPGRAPDDALARGERAFAGLAGELLRAGGTRLAAGAADDLARLVPEYVTLPRGVRAATGEVRWSHDRPSS